ncbi:hypothetical protein KI688_007005 [Linnemannia hyalina]|uniref:PiggyBac transposable element-derived protein domain-containing protein n=1 Tax=Linnemannia hyalina TaxID=64524 RepID=A0A9P8BMM2_9FUNG|nr:hypothetical protein KI688_007005 [Linnemannia hyalina]
MDSSLEFLGSFDVSDSQGTIVASAEEVDEAQEEELLFSVRCRTRPTPGTDSSGDEEEEEKKAGDEGVIGAPTPPTKKKAAKKAAKKPVRETRELPPVLDFDNIFRHYKDGHPAQSNLPRALRLDSELSPLTIFTLFFSDPVLTDLADNTNAYAASKGAGTGEGSRQWVKTTPDELRTFLGIIVYMGVFRQNSVSEYWSTFPECPQHNITTFMSLVRFEQLKRFFHVSNPNEPEQHWFSKVEPQASSGPERAADVDGAGMSTHTTTSTRQASSSPKRAADVDDVDTADTASSNKRLRPLQISSGSSTLVEDMQRLLATQPSQIRFDESGALTTICAQEKVIDFRSVGAAIEKILSSRLSKDITMLHMDGLRSMEKEWAHGKRDQALSKQLETLERDYTEGKLHNKRQLYKRLKASYRAPPEALRAVSEVLRQSGWTICQCLNQSDTCIARTVNNAAVPGDIRVITKDSDLMAFESIMSVTMPVKNTWTTFHKDELLNEHGLPTPVHLTLAALVSNNDYTNGVFSYGLTSNVDTIRQFKMTGLDGTVGQDRVEVVRIYVRRYLDIIHQKARTIKDSATQSARRRLRCNPNPTVKAHDKDLRRIETADRQLRVDVTEFGHALKTFGAATDAEATPPPLPTAPKAGSAPYPQATSAGSPSIRQTHGPAEHPPSHKQKIKKQRRHGSRALQRRRQKWRRSRFRSRTDVQDRYVPDTVFLEKASPVDVVELSGLKPSIPRPSKPKEQSPRIDQVPAPAAKKKKKKLLGEPKGIAGPKALKRAFQSVFATVTLTTGSLQGCLGRSTNLSKAEVAQLTQHVSSAVSTVNSAKHIVYKLIEMRILQPLIETGLNQAEDGPDESFLEKILDSDWAERFVQNLLSFVLRNSIVPQGRPPASDKSKDAVAEAISTFNEFKKTLCPGFKALNSTDLALSNIIAELAPKICLDQKLHYRRIPETLRTKLSIDCDGLPEIDQDDTDAGGDAGAADVNEGVDDDDALKRSKKIIFKPGHIQLCWRYFLLLPSSKRPRFCTQAKMSDSFIDINEEALVALLWGEKAVQLDNVWEDTRYTHNWAAAKQRSSYGEVIKELFIGDRDVIKEARNKQQTTYGKRTTTMAEREEAHPHIYGQLELARYLTNKVNFFRERHNASLTAPTPPLPSSTPSSSTTSTPPPLPTPRQQPRSYRYALNNYIRTDGHQLQILAYDLTKPRQSPNYSEFLSRIEKLYPTRQHLIDAFGDDLDSVIVVGIDPGEVVSGAFCLTLPGGKVINLLIKRASLYQPTLAFRDWEQHWKRRHPTAGPGDVVDSSLWTRITDLDKLTTLPSVHDLENSLPSTNYDTSLDALTAAHKKYYEQEPLIHGIYASREWKVAAHEHRMAKMSELDLAVAGVLRMVDEACEGVPVHQRKSAALGYKAALVDEYLTSTMCPTCVVENRATRLAKPSMRTCACVECTRWIHRDGVGAHNIALIGEQYLKSLGRPEPLARPPKQT